MTRCQIVPPFLLERIAAAHPDPDTCACGARTLEIDAELRTRRATATATAPTDGNRPFAVYTADNGSTLPGRKVRAAAAPASGDPAVDEAHEGVRASLALFKEVFGRDSYDGQGAAVVATVHYERDYDNAFWDGTQLVFGDGDGTVFGRFTKPVDVLGHELSHAVTQYTANLTYQGQSGALNESISDVFGSLVKQYARGQTADQADWLIGEGLFTPSVHGTALRSMKAPGTAYDDPRIGKDPQPAHMDDYVHTTRDSGGVHINSGIPNHAFYLAATTLGGDAWKQAGRIWYDALRDPSLRPTARFATFARITVRVATATFGSEVAGAVVDAWQGVGIVAG
jgi:Zn-dependent metalloprotease